MRMNAAETSASSAIAPCTPLTVVSRSSTTAEIDTFISDVSTTSTNMAMASSTDSRLFPAGRAGSDMLRLAPARDQLPHLGHRDHGQARADADQPLVARHLDRVEDALEEAQLGGEDDRGHRQQRRHDERAVVERV